MSVLCRLSKGWGAAALMLAVQAPVAAQSAAPIAGSWDLVSVVLEQNGVKREPYGAAPKGRLTLDSGGGFSIVLVHTELPRITSNNRETPTPDEARAVATGVLGYYGRYQHDPKDGLLTMRVEGSSFVAWNGTTQQRQVTLTDDRLVITNRTTTVGSGTAELVWRRVR